jgi:hypothetical protein
MENEVEKKCTCDKEDIEDHPCPFREEINNDSESTCNCCQFCVGICHDEI